MVEVLILFGDYRVTSGAIVGRTFFNMAWIQLRRIPEVMADRVHAPSLHWKQTGIISMSDREETTMSIKITFWYKYKHVFVQVSSKAGVQLWNCLDNASSFTYWN